MILIKLSKSWYIYSYYINFSKVIAWHPFLGKHAHPHTHKHTHSPTLFIHTLTHYNSRAISNLQSRIRTSGRSAYFVSLICCLIERVKYYFLWMNENLVIVEQSQLPHHRLYCPPSGSASPPFFAVYVYHALRPIIRVQLAQSSGCCATKCCKVCPVRPLAPLCLGM